MGEKLMSQPPSQRITLKRGKHLADYDPSTVRSVLDSGFLAHVGVATDDGPIVLPMVYGRDDAYMYLHGGVANAMLRAGRDVEVCVTVTIVDGLIVARTPLHNSMNYRSVVIRGRAERVDDESKVLALKIINDHIAPTWDDSRPPSDEDLRVTQVLRVPLDEASAKIRTGEANDEPADLDGPHWAGVVPLRTTWEAPVANSDLVGDMAIPAELTGLAGRDAHP